MEQTLVGKYCKDVKIYSDEIDEATLSIIYSIINHPAFEGQKVRIMPDCHAGQTICVGFSSTIGDYINPDHIGCDIGCTISTHIYHHNLCNIDKSQYPLLEHRIRKAIKFGVDIQETKLFEDKEFYEFLNKQISSASNKWPEMIENAKIDEKYISKMCKRIGMQESIFYKSIGSVGGGNHFIEIGLRDDKDMAVTVHCGSRNLGVKVWKYWVNEAKKNSDYNGYLNGEKLAGYLQDMAFTQAYALFNHKIIHKEISKILAKLNKTGKLDPCNKIETTHNYIDFNGSEKIIRKGCIDASLNKQVVIPFNMQYGLLIGEGLGNEDWNYSAPHGAGRKLSRNQAKLQISMDDFKTSMEGIYSTSVNSGTIDEAPQAYKEPSGIISQIDNKTIIINYFIKPVINMKSSAMSEYEQ